MIEHIVEFCTDFVDKYFHGVKPLSSASPETQERIRLLLFSSVAGHSGKNVHDVEIEHRSGKNEDNSIRSDVVADR